MSTMHDHPKTSTGKGLTVHKDPMPSSNLGRHLHVWHNIPNSYVPHLDNDPNGSDTYRHQGLDF